MPAMRDSPPATELIEHLRLHCGLERSVAVRVIEEVTAFYDEPVDDFIRRCHLELQAEGLGNSEIYARLQAAIANRPFAAQALSTRQIRRIIYG